MVMGDLMERCGEEVVRGMHCARSGEGGGRVEDLHPGIILYIPVAALEKTLWKDDRSCYTA